MNDEALTMVVEEQEPLDYTIGENEKPTQTKSTTPTEEAQTVLPDAGYLLDQVNVAAIPEQYIVPEGKVTFTENVSGADIAQYAEADIAVPPPVLQTKTVTPTEQQQIVEPNSGVYGLSAVTVNRIPQEFIVPSGSLDIIENADGIVVRDKETVNVRVPVPTMPDEYPIGGSLVSKTLTGYKVSQNAKSISEYFAANCNALTSIDLPNTIEVIGSRAFYFCANLELQHLPNSLRRIDNGGFWGANKITISEIPATLTTIGLNNFAHCYGITELTFLGDIQRIEAGAFHTCSNCALYNFRNCTSVPVLGSIDAFSNIYQNAKIVVPDNLYNTWIAASNWINYASYIISVSDYEALQGG